MSSTLCIIDDEILICILIVIEVTRHTTQVRDLQMVNHTIRIPAIVEGEGIVEMHLAHKREHMFSVRRQQLARAPGSD